MNTAVETTGLYRRSNFIEKLVLSKLFWFVMTTLLFAYPLLKSINRHLPSELPLLGQVPAFSFVDESGKAFGTNELKGKVYIVHFMSSHCSGICDLSFAEMQKVQHRIRGVIDRAAIVSITIDPANDNQQVRFDRARELKANPNVWRFVAGPIDEVQNLLLQGFKVPAPRGMKVETIDDVVKANQLVLVDQDGNIRGYYPILKDGINKLMIDTGLIINKKKNS
ncbi:MAG: SCO family protein [Bacteriovoracaceae bacterium]|nr:SCO family protein [Bacteriovoracaceae bacterium]